MRITRVATMMVVVVVSLGLSACHWHAVVGHDQQRGTYGEIGVDGTFSAQLASVQGIAALSSNSINPNDLYIKVTSSNTQLVTNFGTFTVKLTDGNGDLVAAKQFSYHRSGEFLVPNNPSAISIWANSYPNVAGANMSVNHLVFQDGASGTASMQLTAIYQGQQKASASQSWSAHGGLNGNCGTQYACIPQ